jgi:sulfopyruvate decarboxylase subunit beta
VLTDEFPDIPLTREEDGVGIAAGAVLAGAKPVMIVQSSGIGNMVNALLSLTKYYELPLPIFVSQRGVYKENVSAQIPMGAGLSRILAAMDIEHETFTELKDLTNLEQDIHRIYRENKIKCYLLSPKLFEGLPKKTVLPPRKDYFSWMKHRDENLETEEIESVKDLSNLKSRLEALEGLSDFLNDKAVICNMGFPSRELYSVVDQESNFYMLGSLGLVSSIGLGVSLFTEKHVIVIDGDGSLLMNPNALFHVGALQPRNLTIVCVDNGAYGSTGDQPTLSSFGFEVDRLAKASNIRRILVTDTVEDIPDFHGPGPNFIRLLISAGNAKVGTISLSPLEIRDRFMKWLHG